jgi:hypothetical protein
MTIMQKVVTNNKHVVLRTFELTSCSIVCELIHIYIVYGFVENIFVHLAKVYLHLIRQMNKRIIVL